MELVTPFLPLAALVVLVLCGGGWRKVGFGLAAAAVLVVVVASAIGYLIDRSNGQCQTDLCGEDITFLLALALEVILGAVAVLLAAVAALARLLRA